MQSKCEMAEYCKMADGTYCLADTDTIIACPHLNAIGEITMLNIKEDVRKIMEDDDGKN